MKNLVPIIVLTLAVLGCKMPSIFESANSNSSGVANGSDTSATENAEAAPTDDPRADVVRTSKKFLAQSQFSATMDGEGKTPMHIELEYQAPDRFHMISTQPSNRGFQMETIIIGRDMYMKQGERWQKLPGALGKTMPQIREFFDEKGLQSLTGVTYVGEETIDGENTYIYTYRNEAGKELSPYPFTSRIWVRAADGLPAKIEVSYEGGELKTMSVKYDYDKAVTIEPPIK